MLTLNYARQSPVVLELVERLLEHVLWVDLLNTQQVEHHIVGQVKGTVQRVCRALQSTKTTEMYTCTVNGKWPDYPQHYLQRFIASRQTVPSVAVCPQLDSSSHPP